jgi:hypothetical protein
VASSASFTRCRCFFICLKRSICLSCTLLLWHSCSLKHFFRPFLKPFGSSLLLLRFSHPFLFERYCPWRTQQNHVGTGLNKRQFC